MFKRADVVLDELGITAPDEIDIEAIAYCLGARVKYKPLDGCAARIVGRADKAIITVDSASSWRRIRFSIGHELGHWMRDRGRQTMLCKKSDLAKWSHEYRRNPEALANAYASDLLMPRVMFAESAHGKPMTFDTVENLCNVFDTSKPATTIRLVDLGSFPAMVVCHSRERRLWYSKGPDLPDFLHPHRELRSDTKAFDLLYGGSGISRPTPVDADAWINLRNSTGYIVHEHSTVTSDGNVLSLIWWKDESQLVDLG